MADGVDLPAGDHSIDGVGASEQVEGLSDLLPFYNLLDQVVGFESPERGDVHLWAEYAMAEYEDVLERISSDFNRHRLTIESRAASRFEAVFNGLDAMTGISSALIMHCQREREGGHISSAESVTYAAFLVWHRAISSLHEIGALLRAGLSSGAAGRWRTLLELAVISIVLNEGDRHTAQRFIDHRWVQLWKDLRREPAGEVPEKELERTRRRSDRAIAKYGTTFKESYGWADLVVQEKLGRSGGGFAALMQIADLERHARFYRQAHHRVHADSLGARESIDPVTSGLHVGVTYRNVEIVAALSMDLLMIVNECCLRMTHRRQRGPKRLPRLLALNEEIFLTFAANVL